MNIGRVPYTIGNDILRPTRWFHNMIGLLSMFLTCELYCICILILYYSAYELQSFCRHYDPYSLITVFPSLRNLMILVDSVTFGI